uniref:Pre-mRNA-splicing factor 38 n=1 Tax=Hyaloperonospora arabidopsidis (strain Emoy2) TaxID=559515 RepID=M4BIY1_HYAAE
MSRSALTRHALQKSLRGQSELDQLPEETQRRVKQDELPINGNDTTYNLNTLLHQNILQSAYFHELYKLKTYHEVVDEIYYRVDHAEPWSPGTARIPSSCFCLLHKFFLMRLTVKQMQGLLRHTDSSYIRVIGFLYLRYTCDPEKLWTWFEPYLEDVEEFNASANPSLKT